MALAPDDGGIRDSRGLSRALTGDFSGAMEDFKAFVTWAPRNDYPELVSQRERWIAALEANRNPFDASTLEELRGQ